ncbi:MAG: TetR/AcrR family transcriptional regulator [Faecousia sp.]
MQLKLPHEIKSEETKKKIMDATERMLVQYGFKYLTVRNICDEAGVAYGSFYHHFGNKENVIYQFTCQLFQKVREDNPVPDWIDPDDYIKNCLWYFLVYGCFCEMLGKELVKYLYTNCPQEMFAEVYQKEIVPRLFRADEMGYLDSDRNHVPFKEEPVQLLSKDLDITYKGVLLWWSSSSGEDAEPFHETMEHICFNMLYSYCSELYQNADYPHELLTDLPNFPGSIRIDNIFTEKEA